MAASPVSALGGTTGPGDPSEPVWQAICQQLGLDIDALPWLRTTLDEKDVRLYFNSGVFAYRRSSGFAHHFAECTRQVMAARVTDPRFGVSLIEQAAFGLAIVRAGLRYRALPDSCNFNIGCTMDHLIDPRCLREASVLHYHSRMNAGQWDRLRNELEPDRPAVWQWLAQRGPIDERKLGGPCDLVRSGLKAKRRLNRWWFERFRCRRFDA